MSRPSSLLRSKSSKLSMGRIQWIGGSFAGIVVTLLGVWFYFLYTLVQSHAFRVFPKNHNILENTSIQRSNVAELRTDGSRGLCDFRNYPPHRLYNLDRSNDRPFLEGNDIEYIYGEWPKLLHPDSIPTKLCVDQSEWLTRKLPQWPFADGTNPSILHMDRIQTKAKDTHEQLKKHFPSTTWVATVCMTNSQCTWKDDTVDSSVFDVPDLAQTEADTIRTLILLLDDQFQKLAETTVFLKVDAAWGRKVRKPKPDPHMPALDDARLFLHNQQIYVSFREGPGFGYESQVLHPIHWEFGVSGDVQTTSTTILASESSSFCCGRNMALLEGSNGSLGALTWVDPVTIEAVDPTPGTHQKPQKKKKQGGRRLVETKHKSHIHGTNAFMVPVNSEGTILLGIAHFHRPNDRKPNEYARFGHHYTHSFYTVGRDDETLIALSPEFVLPSPYHKDDAEIIQFISGLEKHGDTITLAYGINDCEAAIVELNWNVVSEFLRPVGEGKQVVDFMGRLQS